MRGRSLLVPLLLLTLAPAAQADPALESGILAPVDGLDDADDVLDTGAPSPGGSVKTADAGHDPCVDLSAVFEDPKAVIIIADECTRVFVMVSVQFTEEGELVVTIVVAYAEYTESFVVHCSHPSNWPKVGLDHREWDAACWPNDSWMT